LKKRSKKLLFTVGVGPAEATARRNQEFFCFFFCKKRSASFLPNPKNILFDETPTSHYTT
jgi:hypothetical protein